MPQDKTKLTGGSIGSKGKSVPLRGSMGVSSSSSTLYGCIEKSGTSTFKFQTLTGEATRSGGQTTREQLGKRDKAGFPAQETTGKGGKASGKQGMHHHPLAGKLGNKNGTY